MPRRSDLWPYRGIEPVDGPTPMGHEYAGVVTEIGSDVRNVQVGDFFELALPLEEAAEGYRAMDERRATKVLLTV